MSRLCIDTIDVCICSGVYDSLLHYETGYVLIIDLSLIMSNFVIILYSIMMICVYLCLYLYYRSNNTYYYCI